MKMIPKRCKYRKAYIGRRINFTMVKKKLRRCWNEKRERGIRRYKHAK
jgi:hypothetical protein